MPSAAEVLFLALARAEDAVSRLDQRVQACAFQDGWLSRLDYAEASAFGWNAGDVVSAEELVLHDQGMDVRLPSLSLRAARAAVRARRRAAASGAELLTPQGAAWLASPERRRPPADGAPLKPPLAPDAADFDRPDLCERLPALLKRLEQGTTESGPDAMAEWLEVLHGQEKDTPALLHAALALEAWSIIDPAPRQTYLGPIMVARWLRLRRRIETHLFSFEVGVRAYNRSRRGPKSTAPLARLTYWLAAMSEGASHGLAELHRLELARQVLQQHAQNRRADSRLDEVIRVLLGQPLVTAPLLAETLGMSQTSAWRLLGALGSTVTEISGRSRFRAWRV